MALKLHGQVRGGQVIHRCQSLSRRLTNSRMRKCIVINERKITVK